MKYFIEIEFARFVARFPESEFSTLSDAIESAEEIADELDSTPSICVYSTDVTLGNGGLALGFNTSYSTGKPNTRCWQIRVNGSWHNCQIESILLAVCAMAGETLDPIDREAYKLQTPNLNIVID